MSDDSKPSSKRILAAMIADTLARLERNTPQGDVQVDAAVVEDRLRQGKNFYFGNGVARNHAQAFALFAKAAGAGYPEAQFHLALCFEDGEGTQPDPVQAVHWYRKSATAGYAKAQNNLAICYRTEQGVARDCGEAEKWYRMAAEQGYAPTSSRPVHTSMPHGMTAEHLATLQSPGQLPRMGFYYRYKFDHGTPHCGVEAIRWYLKEAERGSDDAQCSLGVCYELGLGLPQDLTEAAKWFRIAAREDCPAAQNKLFIGIETGRMVPLDSDEAWKWYEREERFGCVKAWRKAAEKGEQMGQFGMGLVYEKGFGQPKDLVEAYKWFRLAAAQNVTKAAERLDSLVSKMTSAQIKEAEQRIREYKPLIC